MRAYSTSIHRCSSRRSYDSFLTLDHLTNLLAACNLTRPSNPNHAHQIHSLLVTSDLLPSPLLHAQLIDLYANSGQLPRALLVFAAVRRHSSVVAWTSLIAHLSRSRQPLDALSLFAQLHASAAHAPNSHTFSAILPACAASGAGGFGRQIHALALRHGASAAVYVASALTDMYAKCGRVEDFRKVFDEMVVRNLVSWNALIVGLVHNKLFCDAMEAFRLLLNDEGSLIPNQVSLSSVLSACSNACSIGFGRAVHGLAVKLAVESSLAYVRNSLIDMYCKCGCLEEAAKVFDRCSDRDVVTWNVMMMACIESDCPEDARGCFLHMVREGISPDETPFLPYFKL